MRSGSSTRRPSTRGPRSRAWWSTTEAAAAEALFVGTHVGAFAGVEPTGGAVRVPYSVFYDVEGDRITALRVYMPMDQLLGQIQTSSPRRDRS
jgi:hypothetical protein